MGMTVDSVVPRHEWSIALAQPFVNRRDGDRTGNVWRGDLVGPAGRAGTSARSRRSIGPADGVARALRPLMVSWEGIGPTSCNPAKKGSTLAWPDAL